MPAAPPAPLPPPRRLAAPPHTPGARWLQLRYPQDTSTPCPLSPPSPPPRGGRALLRGALSSRGPGGYQVPPRRPSPWGAWPGRRSAAGSGRSRCLDPPCGRGCLARWCSPCQLHGNMPSARAWGPASTWTLTCPSTQAPFPPLPPRPLPQGVGEEPSLLEVQEAIRTLLAGPAPKMTWSCW